MVRISKETKRDPTDTERHEVLRSCHIHYNMYCERQITVGQNKKNANNVLCDTVHRLYQGVLPFSNLIHAQM